jgi:cobalt/nickel transport system permease protein
VTTTGTPSWLLEREAGLCPCGCIGKRRKGSYVEKTITGGANVLRQALFTDDIATSHGFLQRVDPRAKVLGLGVLLLATAFVRHIPVLLVAYAITLALAAASHLSISFFVKRVWLFVPIFTGIIVIPATFSFITPGTIVVPLGTWFGSAIGLTTQGLTSAGLIVMRVATSISLVVLLTITTPWPRLLAALRALLVPRMFILVIGMAYRYIFLLLGSVSDMFTARKARTVVDVRDIEGGRAFVASSAGALFAKAHGMSEEVHQAMVSRGYQGNPRTLDRMRLDRTDAFFAVAVVTAVVTLVGVDRLLGG